MSSLLFALFLGIAIAYMILASQFNSFKDPVTIITILPLSIAGAAFALLVTGQSLNIFSMIGLLLLMGIVKKNSIILVDYANAFKAQGFSARESMEKAGPIRLRPILMTAIGDADGGHPAGPRARLRARRSGRPMAIAVIGGLVLSTALSLVVVPGVLHHRGKGQVPEREESRLSSSNQFWIRIISVTGAGFNGSSLTMRNRCPSRDKS